MVALRQPAQRRAESTNNPDAPRSLLVLVMPTLMDPTGQRLFNPAGISTRKRRPLKCDGPGPQGRLGG